jgi:hypothetical protein
MIDFVAYVSAQQRLTEQARNALPDAPVAPSADSKPVCVCSRARDASSWLRRLRGLLIQAGTRRSRSLNGPSWAGSVGCQSGSSVKYDSGSRAMTP